MFPLEIVFNNLQTNEYKILTANMSIDEILKNVRLSTVDYGKYKYTVLYYKDVDPSKYFEMPILAFCRGAVVLEEKDSNYIKQVSFPFSKFFNYQECFATAKLPESNFVVTEKVDGTLIICWRDPITGELRANTRGVLDHCNVVRVDNKFILKPTPNKVTNPFVARFYNAVKRLDLWYELDSLVKENTTVMFELVLEELPASSYYIDEIPENSPRLKPYLLAVRHHDSFKLDYFVESAFPRPEVYTVKSIFDVIELVKNMNNKEGVVVYYPERYYAGIKGWDFLVKIKNIAYVTKTYLLSRRNVTYKRVAELIIEEKIDDLLPYMPDEMKQFAFEFRNLLNTAILELEEFIKEFKKLVEARGLNEACKILARQLNAQQLAFFARTHLLNNISIEQLLKEHVARKIIVDNKEKMLTELNELIQKIAQTKQQLKSLIP